MEWLEQVVARPRDDGDVDVAAPQRPRGEQSSEAGADDDDAMPGHGSSRNRSGECYLIRGADPSWGGVPAPDGGRGGGGSADGCGIWGVVGTCGGMWDVWTVRGVRRNVGGGEVRSAGRAWPRTRRTLCARAAFRDRPVYGSRAPFTRHRSTWTAPRPGPTCPAPRVRPVGRPWRTPTGRQSRTPEQGEEQGGRAGQRPARHRSDEELLGLRPESRVP